MKRLIFIVLILTQLSCVHTETFTASSLDFNEGKIHQVEVKSDLETTIKNMIAVAKDRNIHLVRRSCEPPKCTLELKSEDKLRRLTDAFTTATSYYPIYRSTAETTVVTRYFKASSRYYAKLNFNQSATRVEMIGIPVINDKLSCPKLADQFKIGCQPEEFSYSSSYDSYARMVQNQINIDISGKKEEETVSGILGELQSL